MRIDRLDLIAYGPFSDKSLDLSDGAAGLHLIYGDNEAGKSTSLRALIAWLFGFRRVPPTITFTRTLNCELAVSSGFQTAKK